MPSTYDSLAPTRAIMNKALELGGLTIVVESRGRATRVIQQCYEARTLDRAETERTYTLDDERYGKSPYDVLGFGKKPDETSTSGAWLITIEILKHKAGSGIIGVFGPDGEAIEL